MLLGYYLCYKSQIPVYDWMNSENICTIGEPLGGVYDNITFVQLFMNFEYTKAVTYTLAVNNVGDGIGQDPAII